MSRCYEDGKRKIEKCAEERDEGTRECARKEDQGYKDCCDWWPCSLVCKAWTWISNVVCVAWEWVPNWICVAWNLVVVGLCMGIDAAFTVANALLTVAEAILGWVLSGVAAILQLLFLIPYLGPFLNLLVNIFSEGFILALSVFDIGLGLFGVRPEKKLRVCTVVLVDEQGNPYEDVEYIKKMLQRAVDVFHRSANIRIVPSKTLQFTTPYADKPTVDSSWLSPTGTSFGAEPFYDTTDQSSFGRLVEAFGFYLRDKNNHQLTKMASCFFHNWRRVVGYGSPVTIIVVQSIRNQTGSPPLGVTPQLSGYVFVGFRAVRAALQQQIAANPGSTFLEANLRTFEAVIAHELGHACNWWAETCAISERHNVMYSGACGAWPDAPFFPDPDQLSFTEAQINVIRASRHVTYF